MINTDLEFSCSFHFVLNAIRKLCDTACFVELSSVTLKTRESIKRLPVDNLGKD